ncbi:hypothetical protein RF11_06153 [Thelohanellus kitauei]|uniref:Uncharacterized protein n=1 Tax=Thelohanellus kitauei TaxID=669202 RepID=A0A0C2IHW1_THEKT|nr:hypothetical protein RF11_06153 [Thelohanellus kitauei]
MWQQSENDVSGKDRYSQRYFNKKWKYESCRYIGMPFPHGCINFRKDVPLHDLEEIYIKGKKEMPLYYKDSMEIPPGLLLNQLYYNGSIYMICGLDFITIKEAITFSFRIQHSNEFVEFCFKVYKDMYMYEPQGEDGITILPSRYFHKDVYFVPDRRFVMIDLSKYEYIYRNLYEIRTVCSNPKHNAVLRVSKYRWRSEFDLNGFYLYNSSSGWEFGKKKHERLSCYVYLKWIDEYSWYKQTTVFQVTDYLNIIKDFNKHGILFDFGPYQKNFKLIIFRRGFVDYLCGDDIKDVDAWCTEKAKTSRSSKKKVMIANHYAFPDHYCDFAIVVFSAGSTNDPLTSAPIYRIFLNLTEQKIYDYSGNFLNLSVI